MKVRPILFSGEMVRAILNGTKTQTRRVVKLQPSFVNLLGIPFLPDGKGPLDCRLCPYGVAGDRLWVQENYRLKLSDERWVNYPASGDAWKRWTNPTEAELEKLAKRIRHVGLNTPGRFMYRSLSRITLEIVSVRVERLQDIREADAIAEGCSDSMLVEGVPMWCSAAEEYGELWERINGAGSWAENPWVWVVEFKRVEGGR